MKYLSNYTEQAQTDLFNSTGAFFAFGQDQFDEAKKEGIKYVSLAGGLICPKDQVNVLIDGLNNIQKAGIKADTEENGARAIIEREYFNHECQISGDTSNARDKIEGHIEMFPELFTETLINDTFRHCFRKAIDNDWF